MFNWNNVFALQQSSVNALNHQQMVACHLLVTAFLPMIMGQWYNIHAQLAGTEVVPQVESVREMVNQ